MAAVSVVSGGYFASKSTPLKLRRGSGAERLVRWSGAVKTAVRTNVCLVTYVTKSHANRPEPHILYRTIAPLLLVCYCDVRLSSVYKIMFMANVSVC